MDDLGLYLTVDPDGKLAGELLSVRRIEDEHLTGDAAHPAFMEVRWKCDCRAGDHHLLSAPHILNPLS